MHATILTRTNVRFREAVYRWMDSLHSDLACGAALPMRRVCVQRPLRYDQLPHFTHLTGQGPGRFNIPNLLIHYKAVMRVRKILSIARLCSLAPRVEVRPP
jgi:hypothetical protein